MPIKMTRLHLENASSRNHNRGYCQSHLVPIPVRNLIGAVRLPGCQILDPDNTPFSKTLQKVSFTLVLKINAFW